MVTPTKCLSKQDTCLRNPAIKDCGFLEDYCIASPMPSWLCKCARIQIFD
jgi:hypothetical protein